jgi:hypothetical protein
MAVTEIQFGKDKYHEVETMIKWCYEHFGEGGWLAKPGSKWSVDSGFGNTFFIFKNEKDATIFALRWK